MGHNPNTMANGTLTLDSVFNILQNRHRRIALGVLKTQERALTLRDLTSEIAAREYGPQITEIPTENIRQIYLSVGHIHVPKLTDEKIIEYDQERSLIIPTDRLEQLEPYLSMALEADPALSTICTDSVN